MLKLKDYIDVIIPRGGEALIQKVVRNSQVPTIETGIGIVSIFVNFDADFDMADKIIINSKCSYPAVCNAIETLLVHEDIAEGFLVPLKSRLNNVELLGDEITCSIIKIKVAKTKEV